MDSELLEGQPKIFFSERKLHSQLQLPGIADALAQEAVEVEQRCGGQRVNVVLAIEGIKHLHDWDQSVAFAKLERTLQAPIK